MAERELTVQGSEPVRLNRDLGAHFVTRYDDETRRALVASMTKLPTLDKICLLQDATLLARAGLQSSAELLPLALALKSEANEKVYGMAAGLLGELRKFVDDDEAARNRLKQLSADFARPTVEALGWDERTGESDDDRERRSTALGLLLYGEDAEALAEAKRRFDASGLEGLSTETRALILSTVVRHFETPALIDQLLETYTKTPSNDLQLDIATALTSTRSLATTQRLLAALKDSATIRPQDASRWFVYLVRTRDSRAAAWQWLKENWAWIAETFGGDKSYDDFLRYAATALLTRAELDDFAVFTAPLRAEPALTRTIDLGLTEITARVELIERDGAAVIASLMHL